MKISIPVIFAYVMLLRIEKEPILLFASYKWNILNRIRYAGTRNGITLKYCSLGSPPNPLGRPNTRYHDRKYAPQTAMASRSTNKYVIYFWLFFTIEVTS